MWFAKCELHLPTPTLICGQANHSSCPSSAHPTQNRAVRAPPCLLSQNLLEEESLKQETAHSLCSATFQEPYRCRLEVKSPRAGSRWPLASPSSSLASPCLSAQWAQDRLECPSSSGFLGACGSWAALKARRRCLENIHGMMPSCWGRKSCPVLARGPELGGGDGASGLSLVVVMKR